MKADLVVAHLKKYGLIAKDRERLGSDGVRVLGLRVDESLSWHRDGRFSAFKNGMSKREAHSTIGEWLGHHPVGN